MLAATAVTITVVSAPTAQPGSAGGLPARDGGRRPLRAEADGHVRIPIAERLPTRLPAEGVPAGWEVKEFLGRADVELVRVDGALAVRLRSERTSYALHRDVMVDLREQPMLAWSWKVVELPAGGDVRRVGTDDQAAQLYVVFPRWPTPQRTSDVIGYVWDTTAPAGTRLTSPKAENVKIIVVESGPSAVGQWRSYVRDVAEDYRALFGRQAPRVGHIAVMIDTNDTRRAAETLVRGLVFRPTDVTRGETPTSMLR